MIHGPSGRETRRSSDAGRNDARTVGRRLRCGGRALRDRRAGHDEQRRENDLCDSSASQHQPTNERRRNPQPIATGVPEETEDASFPPCRPELL